jgi:hypothetical protein
MLHQFSSDSNWYGESVPDIAFIQLQVRETPFLQLANDEFLYCETRRLTVAGALRLHATLDEVGVFRQGVCQSLHVVHRLSPPHTGARCIV